MRFTQAAVIAVCMSVPAHLAKAQETSPPAVAEAEPDTLFDRYEESPITLPLGIGLRIPSYDRVNGLSLPWGPVIRIPGGRVQLDPTVTYRSHLGNFDPALAASVAFGRFDSLSVYAGRGTFTNDSWIRSDIVNSLAALGVGSDARNYFRADRVTADLSHSFGREPWAASVWIGGLHERDWSTGLHDRDTETGPWSFFGRTDSLKMRRLNPSIARGNITSGLAGLLGKFERDELTGAFNVKVEHSFDEPDTYDADSERFTQATIDANVAFPTFGLQSFEFRGHAIATSGAAPSQRFGYIGGAGTLATVDLLALRGDRLVFVQGEYRFPLRGPLLPLVGPPVLSLLYAAGSAGLGSLPDFIQNVGVGLGVKLVKVEYHVDPNFDHKEFTHRNAFTVGLSLSL